MNIDTFIKENHTSGTLLLMNYQLKDKNGNQRFYVVEIEFDQADMDEDGGSFVPERGPFNQINVEIEDEKVSIDLIAKPFPNLIPGRKFNDIPKSTFWIAPSEEAESSDDDDSDDEMYNQKLKF